MQLLLPISVKLFFIIRCATLVTTEIVQSVLIRNEVGGDGDGGGGSG